VEDRVDPDASIQQARVVLRAVAEDPVATPRRGGDRRVRCVTTLTSTPRSDSRAARPSAKISAPPTGLGSRATMTILMA
jgi:hypothetical protein